MKFIPVAQPHLTSREKQYAAQAIASTWISSSGKFLDRFEKAFAGSVGTKYATTTNSGTSALHLSLLAAGVVAGDEVIVPALTFVATANACAYIGAKPIFVDISDDTWTINPDLIEQVITQKTRAIIPVHLYGYPADMDAIMRIAKKYNLVVIEDAAEAHGAHTANKSVGSIGDIGAFSFYGNKIITTGEGGMITTNSKKLYEQILLLKNHGMSENKRYYHPVLGYNYRMTNLQAAIGLAQTQAIAPNLARRDQIEHAYRALLADIPGLRFQPRQKHVRPVCWLFSMLVTKAHLRSKLQANLRKHGIDSRRFFHPLHTLPMYKNTKVFPVAEQVAHQGISLPTFYGLKKSQIHYIAQHIRAFLTQ